MRRKTAIAALLAAAVRGPAALAQSGLRDRYFTRYPFDEWKSEGPVAHIKWSPRVLPPRLSAHQRLLTRMEFEVDTKELARRGGRGEFIIFAELTDAAGLRWRTHETFDLSRIPPQAERTAVRFSQDAFVLPGDYQVVLALCDSQTRDHSLARLTLRVHPLRSDPLPGAWVGLPAVEYVRQFPQPDVWYQPYQRGRLQLPVPNTQPVHLDIVMNITPSERHAASPQALRGNLSVLLPALKVLTSVDLRSGSLNVTVLDLATRQAWEQRDAHPLDWAQLRPAFAEANPGVIDVDSLAAKAGMLRFFRDHVAAKLEAGAHDDARIVIVLSAPVFLQEQNEAKIGIAVNPRHRLYYLRDRPLPSPRTGFSGREGALPPATALAADDIEHVVKALGGRLFSVLGPEQFRKALAAILHEISRF